MIRTLMFLFVILLGASVSLTIILLLVLNWIKKVSVSDVTITYFPATSVVILKTVIL